MAKDHEHQWVYDGKSCCFRLACAFPGCQRQTKAYYFDGDTETLRVGTPVELLEDGETIRAIGSALP